MSMKLIEKLAEQAKGAGSASPVTAAFLGDSVTHGCFELKGGPAGSLDPVCDYQAVYHNQLRSMLSDMVPGASLTVVNAGVNGDSAPGGAARIERDVLSRSPDLAIVCFGLNDVHNDLPGIRNYTDALSQILRGLKSRGIDTLLLTPCMMNTYVSPHLREPLLLEIAVRTARFQNEGVMDAYMDAARATCAAEGVAVCDAYRRWKLLHAAGVDTTALLCNHINHPNRDMHRLFAAMLLETLITH